MWKQSSKPCKSWEIKAAIRSSRLSCLQLEEIQEHLRHFLPTIVLCPIPIITTGDRDQKTSLRFLAKTDFFTKEVDEQVEKKGADIAIHSAKDLPDVLSQNLCIAAITKGVGTEDSLVFRKGYCPKTFPSFGKVGVSSMRREQNVRNFLQKPVCPVDIRGTVEKRLARLEKDLDAVVIAEAALYRLQYPGTRTTIPGDTHPLQGKLAIVVRKENVSMQTLFSLVNGR